MECSKKSRTVNDLQSKTRQKITQTLLRGYRIQETA